MTELIMATNNIELFRLLLHKLTEQQFESIMDNENYIKRNFNLVKLSEKRIMKMDKLVEEIKEMNKNQCPQEILDLYNIRTNRDQDQIYFKFLCKKLEMEKFIIKTYKKRLLNKINLTG